MGAGTRISLALAIALGTVGQSVHAGAVNADGGVCKLEVTITASGGQAFKTFATAGNISVPYSMSVSGVDLDPITDGSQHCLYAGAVPPYRTTTVVATAPDASEARDIMTCDFMLSWGWWSQDWSGSAPTDRGDLVYAIAGTWGAWVMRVRDLSLEFAAVIPLTFKNPADVANLSACKDDPGVSSIQLVGTEIFVDPVLGV